MKRTMMLFVILFTGCIEIQAQIQRGKADDIFKAACQQAGDEHKNVIIIFHASWCKWCHKMENSINDSTCQSLFDNNYVIKYITVEESKDKKDQETPGGEAMKNKYNGKDHGLPFWLVFDPNGHLLADGMVRNEGQNMDDPGQNIGCPASEEEVVIFTGILKRTSQLKEDELEIIANRFKQNAVQ